MIRPGLCRIGADQRGVTLIEFAIVAPVFLLLLMGLLDLTYRMYVTSILNGAMQQAGRSASLESGPGALTTIDAKVIKSVREVARNLTYQSTFKSFADYTKIAPEPFKDLNSNSIRDAGECYADVNDNSQWDANPGKTGVGGAKDSVVYTMSISYPRVFPMARLLGWTERQEVQSTTIFKNQPFNSQNTPTVATRCT